VKERLLDYLVCPVCGDDLDLSVAACEGPEIITGSLHCSSCVRSFDISRGVPRFAPVLAESDRRTARAFGYEWTRYREIGDRYRQQFLDWIRPVETDFFGGRTVLEGGCGKGRHTRLAAEFGARDVVAVDLSEAVDTAFANTRDLESAHIVQADVHSMPVRPVFDYGFSVGVLHHLPDPEQGFASLVSKIRPGGHVSAWVYGREGNGWIVHFVTPVRKSVTSRLPPRWLDGLSAALTAPLFATNRLVYGPTGGSVLGIDLPYREYLTYIAPFPYREHRSIVFDHLAAPISHYVRGDEFTSWFEAQGLEEVRIERHNKNSWRGFGRVPPAEGR